jgi:dGTPase
VIDIEDGYRLGRLAYAEAEELFWPLVADPQRQSARLRQISGTRERVEFLRAKVINHVIQQVVACFLDLEGELLTGRFDGPLLNAIPGAAAMQRLIDVANERIYCAPEVVEIETAGFQVIGDLLERFVEAVDDLAEHGEGAMPRSRMMSRLIPEQFVGEGHVPAPDLYTRLLRLTDFTSGMTDSYAVSLYKKITGIALPGG